MRNFQTDRREFRKAPMRKYPATCGKCGRECEVPFRPSGDRPVLCSDCFEKSGGGGGGPDRPRRNFDNRSRMTGNDSHLLASIDAKLGKILELMTEKK